MVPGAVPPAGGAGTAGHGACAAGGGGASCGGRGDGRHGACSRRRRGRLAGAERGRLAGAERGRPAESRVRQRGCTPAILGSAGLWACRRRHRERGCSGLGDAPGGHGESRLAGPRLERRPAPRHVRGDERVIGFHDDSHVLRRDPRWSDRLVRRRSDLDLELVGELRREAVRVLPGVTGDEDNRSPRLKLAGGVAVPVETGARS